MQGFCSVIKVKQVEQKSPGNRSCQLYGPSPRPMAQVLCAPPSLHQAAGLASAVPVLAAAASVAPAASAVPARKIHTFHTDGSQHKRTERLATLLPLILLGNPGLSCVAKRGFVGSCLRRCPAREINESGHNTLRLSSATSLFDRGYCNHPVANSTLGTY